MRRTAAGRDETPVAGTNRNSLSGARSGVRKIKVLGAGTARGDLTGSVCSDNHGNMPPNERPAVLDLIGNTPVVRITRMDTGPCELFLKLESQNPGGSIKDRIGRSMIETAERDGTLKEGGTVIEATAGNTGLGLALVARAKGYRVVLVVPDKMSTEKVLHLKALGAQVHMTRSDVGKGHPEYYQDYAGRLAREIPGAFYSDQFNNPANPLAHETSTGPEIWQQCGHDVDAIVVGVGSAGTLTGLTRFFRRVYAPLEFVLADPVGSILCDYVKTGHYGSAGSWTVEGIGEDFVPPIADFSAVKHAYSITDEESFATARALLKTEGISAGSSTGTLLAAALRFCRSQTRARRVVTFACDTGTRYLSKLYNDAWMIDEGLLAQRQYGDLRDLIARRAEDGGVIHVMPQDTLLTAFQRMRLADVQQLPVLDGGQLVGVIDESDLLLHVQEDASRYSDPVRTAMSTAPQTLPPDAGLPALRRVLDSGLVAIIADAYGFHGLITRFDLLNHLRRARR
jgi:cystathionine beta-synthase